MSQIFFQKSLSVNNQYMYILYPFFTTVWPYVKLLSNVPDEYKSRKAPRTHTIHEVLFLFEIKHKFYYKGWPRPLHK